MKVNRVLLGASFVFMVGVGAVVSTLPVVLRQISSNEVEVSLAVTVWGLVYLLASVPAGVLADKVGANKLVPLAFASNAPVGLAMYASRDPLSYALARAAEGVVEAVIWTSVIGLSAKLESRSRVLGISGVFAAIALGFSLGPALGGLLARYSPRLAFLLFAACSLVSAAVALPLLSLEPVRVGGGSVARPSIAVLPPLLTAFAVGVSESIVIVHSPTIASLGNVEAPGYVVSEYYALGLLGQLSLRLLHRYARTEAYLALALLTPGLALLASPPSLAVLAVALLGFFNAHLTSGSQARISELMRGIESTGAGLANFAWALGYFLGAPIYSAAPIKPDPLKAIAAALLLVSPLHFARTLAQRG